MRNIVLIACGMILLSTAVQAGETRSLSLSTGETAAPRAADGQRAADATTPAVAQPAPQAQIAPSPPTMQAMPAPAEPRMSAQDRTERWQNSPAPLRRHAARASKPRDRGWTRSRIISELHRHGIYW